MSGDTRRAGTTPLRGRPLDDNGAIEFQPVGAAIVCVSVVELEQLRANTLAGMNAIGEVSPLEAGQVFERELDALIARGLRR